jgi:hypothetical protein
MEPGVDGAKVAEKFSIFIDELKRCVALGIEDGTIRSLPLEQTALIIYGNIVGSVRTSLLSPYESEDLFAETIHHVERSITVNPGREDCTPTQALPRTDIAATEF